MLSQKRDGGPLIRDIYAWRTSAPCRRNHIDELKATICCSHPVAAADIADIKS